MEVTSRNDGRLFRRIRPFPTVELDAGEGQDCSDLGSMWTRLTPGIKRICEIGRRLIAG